MKLIQTNNLFFYIIFFNFIFCQNNSNLLKQLQFKSDSIKQELESDLNKQFLQAKSLEKSGLYNEALLIFKNINQTKPGNVNYYIPLKNYLKQAESLDTLLVYTKSFSNARNNDLQGK